jgi:hypothetical protein
MKSLKMRKAGKIVKPKKRKPPTEKQKKNLFRWKSEIRGL